MSYNRTSRTEEVRSIRRRTMRDNVRLMLLIKEAEENDDLAGFAEDSDMVLDTTKNYLAAYARYVEDGLLPALVGDADEVRPNEVVYEMWHQTYDYTLYSQRYASVEDGVKEVAQDMGLRGFGKAMDIAKNPKSMMAAILGDSRAADAAASAVSELARTNRNFRHQMEDAGFFFVDPTEMADIKDHFPRPRLSFWAKRIIALRNLTMSTRERAFEDADTPSGLIDACTAGAEHLLATRDLLIGRHQMDEVQR